MDQHSAVGVLDKVIVVLTALERGPAALGELVERTGLPKPTAHRLAVALETHRMVTRDPLGRFVLGARLVELATHVEVDDVTSRAAALAAASVRRLRDTTGLSSQFYVRRGDVRVCLQAAEPESGLRDTVPVGSSLTMAAGSAAQVLLSFPEVEPPPDDAAFTLAGLRSIHRRGWAQSVGEREPGVASVSAPVLLPDGLLAGALSVSGPIERLTRSPGRLYAATVVEAAADLATEVARGLQGSRVSAGAGAGDSATGDSAT